MNKLPLILLLMSTSSVFSLPTPAFMEKNEMTYTDNPMINDILSFENFSYALINTNDRQQNEIKQLLQQTGVTLSRGVINKVLTTMQCTQNYPIDHNQILTIIDYSLPSNEKRLWIFDLQAKKLLFHTYVAHGIKSGTLLTDSFSNKNDSKASSIGLYRTDKAYHGREGLTLKLDGLDRGFNDNAMNRAIVMHGGWYVDETFIKKYGRPGRSWGCPAVPLSLTEPIINTIKNNSLVVAYYPSDQWFNTSKFLNCADIFSKKSAVAHIYESRLDQVSEREPILYADLNTNSKREENEAVLVMSADNYEQFFHTKAPVSRMLRRQINQMEYIALSNNELRRCFTADNKTLDDANHAGLLNALYLVVPEVTMDRGYYITHMKMVSLGKIKEVKLNTASSTNEELKNSYSIYFDKHSAINLKTTNHFIRWLGL